jgi:hypothetical protein
VWFGGVVACKVRLGVEREGGFSSFACDQRIFDGVWRVLGGLVVLCGEAACVRARACVIAWADGRGAAQMMTIVYFAFFMLLNLELVSACCSYRPPPPPPPPPPPNSPPVPPAPPPINKVIRQQVQAMTRNNCQQVQITAQNNAALAASNTEDVQAAMKVLNVNECLNAENYAYSCSFTVYSEIALTTIYHPTGCGCAFTIQVRRVG